MKPFKEGFLYSSHYSIITKGKSLEDTSQSEVGQLLPLVAMSNSTSATVGVELPPTPPIIL